jgi:hypothetical protein
MKPPSFSVPLLCSSLWHFILVLLIAIVSCRGNSQCFAEDLLWKPEKRPIEKARVVAEKIEGDAQFVVLNGDAAPQPWRIGESRRFHALVVNVGKAPFQVPAIGRPRHGSKWIDLEGVGFVEDTRTLPDDVVEEMVLGLGSLDHFDQIFKFVDVAPGESIGMEFALTPLAPGLYRASALAANSRRVRTERGAVRHPDGVLVPTFNEKPVPNAWSGVFELEVSFEVAADPTAAWAAKRTRLDRLFDDAAATDEQRIAAFKEVVAGDDWHSWTVCRDALDRPKWRVVHDLARDRILELYEWGMPGVEWQDFLDQLTKNPEWQTLRPSAVPLVATVARRFILRGSKPGGVIYWPSDETADRARELLATWSKDKSGALAGKARAALAELPPVPRSADERGVAGHAPGTPIPDPIAVPAGPVDGKVVVSIPLSMYYLPSKAAKALAKDAPNVKVEIHDRDERNAWERFDRKEVDVMAFGHAPRALDSLLGKRYPDPSPWPSMYWFGDSVACVVVHPRNPLTEIDLTKLRQIFMAVDAPKWDIVGGRPVQITRYGETGGRTGDIISEVVAGGSSFRNKTFGECESAADLIAKVAADPRAIGFMRFGSEVIDAGKKVKLLAIQGFDGYEKAVLPSMATISDDSYVLRERMSLGDAARGITGRTSLLCGRGTADVEGDRRDERVLADLGDRAVEDGAAARTGEGGQGREASRRRAGRRQTTFGCSVSRTDALGGCRDGAVCGGRE